MMYKDDYFQEWIDEDEYSRRLDLISVRWELRGYGSSAVEAAADGWEKFKNIDEWYMYGYTIEEKAMKIVDEMPTEGQFIKVWKYDGDLWCDTLTWDGDTLFVYAIGEEEGWVLKECSLNKCATDIHYIID